MSKPWPTVSLGELLRLERRKVKVEPEELYQEIGIYCFGRGIFHKNPRTGFEVGDKDLFLMKEGDFILQVTFAWEGAIAIVSAAEDGMFGSTRYPTFRVDESRCDPKFLLNYFKTEQGLQQLVKICPGSAGRNRVLSIKRIPEVQVPLPPLAEQRRVVARIEELAAQIHEARTLRHQATEEAEALWERGASKIFDHASGTYPVRPLAGLVAIRGGGTPSKSDPFYWDGKIPWITPKDMKRRELSDAIDHISERATQESPAKLIEPGAVLVVVRGMILAHTFPSAVLRAPATVNQDMKALIPKKDILPEFLCAQFWARNSQMLERVAKSTHDTRKFETDKLLGADIVVPPLAEQRRIVAELDALQAEVDALKRMQAETAAELDALLPGILDRAFRGEL
jgi:type I restriction enzyme S subunit